jgi:hypothetical protein
MDENHRSMDKKHKHGMKTQVNKLKSITREEKQ